MLKMKYSILLAILFAGSLQAQIKTLVGPIGSGDFGYSVTALANGNYVITDPYFFDGTVQNGGAVYLYDGKTHTLISTLKGKYNDDFLGRDGVFALSNGNFVVLSQSADNGPVVDCGAITWVSGVTGLSGTIAPANSLYGTATNDSLGSGDQYGVGGVVVFDNGNCAVVSPGWDNGSILNAGSVTLLNGSNPTSGVISSANSLVGSSANDRVGSDGIFMLDNNHFIVRSFSWDNGPAVNAGAITWCDGVTLAGQVSSANSLVGTTTDDFYDDIIPTEYRIKKLANGNFVVRCPRWDDTGTGVVDAGAAIWGSNSVGLSGVISSSNSLVGTWGNEYVGGGPGLDFGGVVPLSNGNYVVITPGWRDEYTYFAGAVTWGNGNTGVAGTIDSTNSLVGSAAFNQDEVGSGGVVALSNGNYVVLSRLWSNGASEYVGAATWANGNTGITGKVSPSNSLVGRRSFDFYSGSSITPLSNGNYVVNTPNWDNGTVVDAGAVTWGDGNVGTTGEIDSSKSLIGNKTNGNLNTQVTPLSNGNYVVVNSYWDNGAIIDAGAVTWASGTAGIAGLVDSTNSLVGSRAGDMIGTGLNGWGQAGVAVLSNGNYVVGSPDWDNGTTTDAGAATWANGMTGITGVIGQGNSLVGTTANARVGNLIRALANGNYVVSNPGWNNGSITVGAVTWVNGNTGIIGPVTSSNSLVGSHSFDDVSSTIPLQNGNYLVVTPEWDNTGAPGTGKGALTWVNGLTGISGVISSSNSLVGTSPGDFQNYYFALSEDHYILGLTTFDSGALTNAGALTLASSSSGVTGDITSCNSVIGSSANNGSQLRFSHYDPYGYMVVGHATHNTVKIFDQSGYAIAGSADSSVVNINGPAPVPLLSSGGCNIIATIAATGASPVNGSVKAKIWKEIVVPEYNGHPFVARHYEITPALNASTATARITLYFTQQEFDDYNSHTGSTTDLPPSGGDTSGISKLRIIKYPGTSNDNSGLPASYTGTPVEIDPVDHDIAWNNSLSRWEVSFDVTGFSGFIVQTVNVVTGINDITNNSYLLNVFPNPVHKNLSYELKSTTAGNYTIKIFDLNGRLMYSKEGRNTGNTLRGSVTTDFLSRGVYILEIATRKTTARKKLLKL